MRKRILICDDEAPARRGITRALGRDHGYVECASGTECLERLDSLVVDLVLLDLRMPGLDGRATLERIVAMPSPPPVIIITADADLRTAVEALRAGASDFLAKPYELEELRWVVERTLESRGLARENKQLRARVRDLGGRDELLGDCPALEDLRRELEQVGPTGASVLIRGETGTGKELVARSLHRLSGRGGPFVAINCAAVPETLIESELFGHRRGAFTGADRDRDGRFQLAHGGTLFLDEVGDMPREAQAKLLRVLEERQVEPLGGKPVAVDVRVVAATHQDLERLCVEKLFREDLYYRLRVVEVTVPPLAVRGTDVLLLARAFLDAAGRGRQDISPEAASALVAYPWPGNVRELRNAMERAVIFCREGAVEIAHLPTEIRSADPSMIVASGSGGSHDAGDDLFELDFQEAKARVIDRFERRFLQAALERCAGNISQAARKLGMHRQNLQKKLRQLGLQGTGSSAGQA
jgi:DNA-binding NtrC family response regulator